MASKRFPGKVLKKIYQKQNVFQLIVNNIKKNSFNSQIIVATSNQKKDKKIISLY